VDGLCFIEVAETKSRLKILKVIDTLTVGGAENVFVDIIRRYQKDFQYDVLVIRREKNDEKNYNIVHNIIPIKLLNRQSKFSIISAVKCFLVCREYNIVHVHMRHTFKYIYAVRFIFGGKYKIILHDHDGIDLENKVISKPFFGYKFIQPDIYIAVFEKLKKWAIQNWISNKPAYSLINLPTFTTAINTEVDLFEINDNWVMVGNIKPSKNQLFGIELSKEFKLKLDIVGNIQDADYLKSLNSMIKLFNVKNIQIFENVTVDGEFLKKYKYGLFCSRSESGPLVVLEYLMSGINFVAFKTGAISEMASRYFPEFFIDNWDFTNWKSKIEYIQRNPISNEEYMRRRDELLKVHFSEENYKNTLKEIYFSLS
jgi:glycosyltransferase involved in cell wall biosynthesis